MYISPSSTVDAQGLAGFGQIYISENPTKRCVARSLVDVTDINNYPQMTLPNGAIAVKIPVHLTSQ